MLPASAERIARLVNILFDEVRAENGLEAREM